MEIPVTVPEKINKKYATFTNGLKYIAVSWIHTYFFCPYQLYLMRVKGISVPKTEKMIEGGRWHEAQHVQHVEESMGEMSVEDALMLSRFERKAYKFREVNVHANFKRYQLGGRMDELVIYPDLVRIVDDKPKEVAYESDFMQVFGYALAFKEMFNPDRKIEVVIRSEITGEEIWKSGFTDDAERRIRKALDEIYLLLKDISIPPIQVYSKKCEACSYSDVCEYYNSEENSNKVL